MRHEPDPRFVHVVVDRRLFTLRGVERDLVVARLAEPAERRSFAGDGGSVAEALRQLAGALGDWTPAWADGGPMGLYVEDRVGARRWSKTTWVPGGALLELAEAAA